ncbi:MAG: creatininase family protein [Roseiarcus sp.]|jgi:creatinine amidohydrolase
MLPTKIWAEMSWKDFQGADMANVIAVLPVAAIEQHGPHLPVGVDMIINEGHLRRAIARTPSHLPALFLPIQAIGKSNEHIEFPGTLTFSAETIIRAWTEIGESVARTGCRKMIIVNSHGGNVPAVDIVARELRVRRNMLVVATAWSRFGYPDGMFSARERAHGIHAGDYETSVMLALRPDLVRLGEARDFESAVAGMERDFTWLRATPPVGFGWMSNDLNEFGALGNAAIATAEKGEACADYGATAFIELLEDVAAFDLTRLTKGPLG